MADTKLTSLPTATAGGPNNDARVYIVDDLAASTATSLQTEYQDFQLIRLSSSTATQSITLTIGDADKRIRSEATATHAIRIPPTSSVAWRPGTWIHIVQMATGQVTVSSTSTSVLFRTPATVNARTQYSMISAVLDATGTAGVWILTGDLEPA